MHYPRQDQQGTDKGPPGETMTVAPATPPAGVGQPQLLLPTELNIISLITFETTEAGITCSLRQIIELLEMLSYSVDVAREFGTCELLQSDRNLFHDILAVLMPDNRTQPKQGTAHYLLNQSLCPQGVVLVHTEVHDDICTVALQPVALAD